MASDLGKMLLEAAKKGDLHAVESLLERHGV